MRTRAYNPLFTQKKRKLQLSKVFCLWFSPWEMLVRGESIRDNQRQNCCHRLTNEGVDFPFLTLLVSGGHNLLLLVHNVGRYTQLPVGTTLDDALGEVSIISLCRIFGRPIFCLPYRREMSKTVRRSFRHLIGRNVDQLMTNDVNDRVDRDRSPSH